MLLIWRALKFAFYLMVTGILAIIIILFCYAYLNDIEYTEGFWQYVQNLLSSSEDPMEIVWGVVLHFPFSEILSENGYCKDIIDFIFGMSGIDQIVEENSIKSNIFFNMVQLSVAQLLIFVFGRVNRVLQKIDITFKFVYWYVSIFWVIVSYTISATLLKCMYLIVEPRYLKIVLLGVMVIAFFLHAILLAKSGTKFSVASCIVYIGLDMIFFFIQSVLIWLMGISAYYVLKGDMGSRFAVCFVIYVAFIILKEIITKVLLSAMFKVK